ncbi:MAG: tetratricopeptide repeat protein, partial [Acidobacteria bacterium]|nr:tetratricopeptide repeat protein [Acidobacteriota bacterium]
MRRVAGLLLLMIVGAGLVYGVTVTRRESAYLELIERGDGALGRDDSYAAIEAFTVAISLKGDSMPAHLKRGEAYRRRGEFESALRDLRRASELDPLATQPRELLGDVNYAMGGYARAVERYAEYIELDDRSPRLLYKSALASFYLGEVSVSITALKKALAIDDRFAEGHYLLGVCLREAQQSAEAVKSLQRAVALQPALLQAREELADLYGRMGRNEERTRQLEALAALDPRSFREVTLGLGYARGGQLDRAVMRLGSAAERFPDDGLTHVALGRVWLERAANGDRVELRKALGALEAAVGSDSGSEALTLLGRALLLSGDVGRAEKILQQATARFPVDADAFYYLADVADWRGHLQIAQRALIDFAALERVESPKFDAPLLARLAGAHL